MDTYTIRYEHSLIYSDSGTPIGYAIVTRVYADADCDPPADRNAGTNHPDSAGGIADTDSGANLVRRSDGQRR